MGTYTLALAAGQRAEVMGEGTAWFLRSVKPQVDIAVDENLRLIGTFGMGEGHYESKFSRIAVKNVSTIPCVLNIWIGDGVFSGHTVGLPQLKGTLVQVTTVLGDGTVTVS